MLQFNQLMRLPDGFMYTWVHDPSLMHSALVVPASAAHCGSAL